ncbi:MAG: hypothetical protein ACTSWY_15215 [Promethearchaeota archaeon]
MPDLDYFCFLRCSDNFLLFQQKNLSIIDFSKDNEDDIGEIDYLNIIAEFDISFNVIKNKKNEIQNLHEENKSIKDEILVPKRVKTKKKPKISLKPFQDLSYGVPEVIKHTINNKLQPLYYYFILGKNVVLICVAKEFYPDLKEYLTKFMEIFENIFDEQEILTSECPLDSLPIIIEFCKIFSERIITDFLIPNLFIQTNNVEEIDDVIREIGKELSEGSIKKEILLKIPGAIDGILDIEIITEKLNVSKLNIKRVFLFLWLNKLIYFRIPRYGWNIFERTHSSNQYLYDGSDEQKEMIKQYDGAKIISLLSRFDGKITLKEIRKKIKITDLKFMRYVYDLFDSKLIKIVPFYPVMEHATEEIIPILIIQGLTQEDLKFIEELESHFNGSKTITDVALRINRSPDKIKSILNKLEKFDILKINY